MYDTRGPPENLATKGQPQQKLFIKHENGNPQSVFGIELAF